LTLKRKRASHGMVLPLLLAVLLFGSLLFGLALDEIESAFRTANIHIEQVCGTNEGVSALERGRGWVLEQIEETGSLPRWLDGKPLEDGLLSPEEWNVSNKASLRIHEEELEKEHLTVLLEVLDLDYRLSSGLKGDKSLPPCYFDDFSLFGGTETVDPETGKHLSLLGDIVLSGDTECSFREESANFYGEGLATVLLEEDSQGHSLYSPNGEARIVFHLSESEGVFPDGFDLGFRLGAAPRHPEEAMSSGYSVSFSIEDPVHPENRDRFILKRNSPANGAAREEILASIPFTYCRSMNIQDQERYRAYLSQVHEIRLGFDGDRATVVLDPGKGTLEKRLEAFIDPPSSPEELSMPLGLRVRSRTGAGLAISSLRIHPADSQGYFPECKRRGFYLVRAIVQGNHIHQTYETILSADLSSRKVQGVAWQEKPFF